MTKKQYWFLPKFVWRISRKKYRGIGRPRKTDYYKDYRKPPMTKPLAKITRSWTDRRGNWRYKAVLRIPMIKIENKLK